MNRDKHRAGLSLLARLQANDRGAGMVEYALLILMVAVALIGAVTLFAAGLSASFNDSASLL